MAKKGGEILFFSFCQTFSFLVFTFSIFYPLLFPFFFSLYPSFVLSSFFFFSLPLSLFRLSQLFRSVSDAYTLRSVRRKKLLSMSRDVSAVSRNFETIIYFLPPFFFLQIVDGPWSLYGLMKTRSKSRLEVWKRNIWYHALNLETSLWEAHAR